MLASIIYDVMVSFLCCDWFLQLPFNSVNMMAGRTAKHSTATGDTAGEADQNSEHFVVFSIL